MSLRERSFFQVLREGGKGIFGQSLSFLAMLIPLYLGQADQISTLIICSAIGTVAAGFGTCAAPSVLPTLKTDMDLRLGMSSSVQLLLFVTVTGLLVSLIAYSFGMSFARLGLWATCFTVAQGAYLLALALVVRGQHFELIARMRIIFGSTLIIGTLIACLLLKFFGDLVMAQIVSLAITSSYCFWKLSKGRSNESKLRFFALLDTLKYIKSNLQAAISILISGMAFQTTSFTLLLLGNLSPPWALVLRIAGGFGTTAQQLVAPYFEGRFSEAVRNGANPEARTVQRRGLLAGFALGVGTCACVLGTLLWSNTLRPLSSVQVEQFLFAAFVFTLSIITASPVAKNLVLAGGQRFMLGWAILKGALAVSIMFLFHGMEILLGVALLEAFFQFIYVLASRRLLK